MLIVDSQVHLWAADSPARPWPPGNQALAHRAAPLGAAELLADMDRAGVDRVVIVPPSWEGDRNDVALAAADRHPDRFAVMGRLALRDPHSPGRIAAWRPQPGILRPRFPFHTT